jgi:hypothetical protein
MSNSAELEHCSIEVEMSILLTITEQELSQEDLRPFLMFDGIDDAYVSTLDVSEEYSSEYERYRIEWNAYRSSCGFILGRFVVHPKPYARWLKARGVRLLKPLEAMGRDERVFIYANVDVDNNVLNVLERANIDIWAKDGGLLRGSRLADSELRFANLLDDGACRGPGCRQKGNLHIGVLLADDTDVQISIWQYWERRYYAYYCQSLGKPLPFDGWRNDIYDKRLNNDSSVISTFFQQQCAEIPAECRSRQDFIEAAIAVGCDAVLHDGRWYERDGNSWADVVKWSQFVNDKLRYASANSWIATIEY